MKFKSLLAAILLVLATNLAAQAQENTKKYYATDYEKNPVWIDMMRDPSPNFDETVKAFREFWKDRILPEEPMEKANGTDNFELAVGLEKENETAEERAAERREKDEKLANQTGNEINYADEVRAFKGWFYYAQQWLKKDGTVMTMQEQQAIINKQQAELKQIENQNGNR